MCSGRFLNVWRTFSLFRRCLPLTIRVPSFVTLTWGGSAGQNFIPASESRLRLCATYPFVRVGLTATGLWKRRTNFWSSRNRGRVLIRP